MQFVPKQITMKKLLSMLMALLLSSVMMAGSLVKISYSNQAELEKLFADPNLIVHHYTNTEVYATAERFDANTMVMIDENAFQDCEVYTLLYGGSEPVVAKGPAMPLKNDGAVAIINKKAILPRRNRDFPVITEEDPIIREMMEQVNMDSLEATVQYLQDYGNRMWNSDNAFAASDWVASKMQAYGLEVEQQPFYASTWTGSGQAAPNVIGIQRGTHYPNTYVVCGSHFDSFSYEAMYGGGSCPGADDNATGVASVLESARILTQYALEYSVIYCAFGCEEMGLFGSEEYAARCQQQGMDIIGYFNNDMNGYLWGDVIHIDCIYPESVAPIGDYYMNVANIYFPEMPVQHVDLTYGDSDHTSFNNHGYMGIYPFEDVEHESPYIHSPNDLIGPSVTSFAMSQRYCQMNIGCLAEIANPVGETPVVSCNPVTAFEVEFPTAKALSEVYLWWQAPEEGSTGELEHFEVYRDNTVIATVEKNPDPTYHYNYMDTITIGSSAEYYIMAVYSDGCEAASETLIGYGITGVEENDGATALVFPNPVKGDLTIKVEGLLRVVVYDQLGQRVLAKETDKDECVIPMSTFPQGLYIVQLTSNKGNVINKNIVKL